MDSAMTRRQIRLGRKRARTRKWLAGTLAAALATVGLALVAPAAQATTPLDETAAQCVVTPEWVKQQEELQYQKVTELTKQQAKYKKQVWTPEQGHTEKEYKKVTPAEKVKEWKWSKTTQGQAGEKEYRWEAVFKKGKELKGWYVTGSNSWHQGDANSWYELPEHKQPERFDGIAPTGSVALSVYGGPNGVSAQYRYGVSYTVYHPGPTANDWTTNSNPPAAPSGSSWGQAKWQWKVHPTDPTTEHQWSVDSPGEGWVKTDKWQWKTISDETVEYKWSKTPLGAPWTATGNTQWVKTADAEWTWFTPHKYSDWLDEGALIPTGIPSVGSVAPDQEFEFGKHKYRYTLKDTRTVSNGTQVEGPEWYVEGAQPEGWTVVPDSESRIVTVDGPVFSVESPGDGWTKTGNYKPIDDTCAPAVPAWVDECGAGNGHWVFENTDWYEYGVVLNDDGSQTISAVAKDGHSFAPDVTTSWTEKDSGEECELIVGGVQAQCVGDVPWFAWSGLSFEEPFVPSEGATMSATFLHPTDPSQNVTITGLTISDEGKFLWPGAWDGSDGTPKQWPGWELQGDTYVETEGNYRWTRAPGGVDVLLAVNPELVVHVTYPDSTSLCANPPQSTPPTTPPKEEPPTNGKTPPVTPPSTTGLPPTGLNGPLLWTIGIAGALLIAAGSYARWGRRRTV